MLRKPFEVSDLSRVMAKAIAEAQGGAANNVIRLRDRQRAADVPSRDQQKRGGPDDGDGNPGNVPA